VRDLLFFAVFLSPIVQKKPKNSRKSQKKGKEEEGG